MFERKIRKKVYDVKFDRVRTNRILTYNDNVTGTHAHVVNYVVVTYKPQTLFCEEQLLSQEQKTAYRLRDCVEARIPEKDKKLYGDDWGRYHKWISNYRGPIVFVDEYYDIYNNEFLSTYENYLITKAWRKKRKEERFMKEIGSDVEGIRKALQK